MADLRKVTVSKGSITLDLLLNPDGTTFDYSDDTILFFDSAENGYDETISSDASPIFFSDALSEELESEDSMLANGWDVEDSH